MTSAFDEAAVRRWLIDYLVTNNGCSPEHIERGASMHDLGVGSRDAVVLTGVLSEHLGRTVSPVDFWQYPTVDALAKFLTGGEVEPVDPAPGAVRSASADEPIAVIGLGLRLPGGDDLDGNISGPDAYWRFLMEGRSSVREVPEDRWSWFDDGSPEGAAALAGTTKWGAFLRDLDAFDAEFFEIIPREATRMDPQQRLLLEVTHEALENAGIAADSLAETQTGVFAGASAADYAQLGSTDLSGVDAWFSTGGALSIIANRVSYYFDLRGPSVTVDTACSSSLVAIHLACQSLRSGDSELALAAGVNLLLSPAPTRSFDQAEAMSPTGRCHAFDAAADGFVRGEGCGVAVLKRLSDALRDGDRVLAVIRGSAVNQDGRSNGLMAPNPSAQMAVLRSAYAAAGVDPREVDYVEAHGTGTLLGDPIEARALGTVLGKGRPADAPLLLGAVKSNLGHLEAAAGIAGFAKAVLALQHNTIPANLGYENPNPHIPFEKLRLKVVAEHTDWAPAGRPRRAGVSSFGFGGTNAHVVIEQAPVLPPAPGDEPAAVTTLVVSGKTPERIASQAQMLADWMAGDGAEVPLAEIAHTLNHHRTRHNKFASVAARDRDQAIAGLLALAGGQSAPGVVAPLTAARKPGTVFVYSGQGSQWPGMARRLLADEPAFAQALAEIEPVFVEQVGFSLHDVISGGEPVSGDAQVQPVLMGLQLALTELWRSHGVHPDAVIGHSMGEVTAAVVAGALSLADGLKVIAARSSIMSRLAGQGAVALLNLDADATIALIAGHPSVEIAGYLSPRQTVVAGLPEQVDAVIAAVTARNTFARRVNMVVASHTALMDPVLPDIRAALAGVEPNIAALPFLSTVTEAWDAPTLDADYWVANVRQPVRFSQAIEAAAADHGTFIEISPHSTLGQAIADTLADVPDHRTIGTLARDGDDTVIFHANVNATHTSRPPRTPHGAEPQVVLPTTPWHRGRHWVDVRPLRRGSVARPGALPADSTVPPQWFCELIWPVKALAPREDSAGVSEVSWLVVGDDALAAEMGRALGRPVATGDGHDLSGATHVLYAPTGGDELGYEIFETGRVIATTAAGLASDPAEAPKLFLLTRNAQPVEAGDRANPAQAVLWGLGRTLALEHPEIWGGVIDLDESVPAVVAAKWVLAEAHDGKTSLGESVARALGRKFVRVALGGVRDEAEIRGHRRTYVGALPGRIVRAIGEAGSMNPVVLLDEIDKVGSDYRGDPAAALLEVLDPAQNHTFRDHYLDLDLDLSDVVFLATANVIENIPSALLDRMELVTIDGYTEDDKVAIARDYLLPRQSERAALTAEEVTVTDAALRKIAADYTREPGVRQFERLLAKALRKVTTKLAGDGITSLTIDEPDLVEYLGRPRFMPESAERTAVPGVATGLAVTGLGGDVLYIEAGATDGESGLQLTGQLGDVMKESAQIALSYVRSHASALGVDPETLDRRIHVHVPAGAVPKDGPSAGVTMVTALVSMATGRQVRADVGMTGEVTLNGRVLPIGGVKQKLLAAQRAGLSTVFIPQRNEADLDDVPADVLETLDVRPMTDVAEIVAQALVPAEQAGTVAA
ncbi:type I polyketide synthase [Mycobacterium sp. NAZ190054]|uniref:type I polyketide synthase n=1 Tax=Mycobacterium sp. NAZ190054 TaxID=1747766 RepID=UPI0009E9FBDF|nr:type I polyketide synthase [Mycobacterium sp. NAZ190054]